MDVLKWMALYWTVITSIGIVICFVLLRRRARNYRWSRRITLDVDIRMVARMNLRLAQERLFYVCCFWAAGPLVLFLPHENDLRRLVVRILLELAITMLVLRSAHELIVDNELEEIIDE